MKLIVGLGNPGKKYKKTRHNIGKEIIKNFTKNFDFPKFKINKKLFAKISKKENIVLTLPTTYMNNSGQAVKLLVTRYGLRVTDLVVIHDDIDLPLGKLKISQNRSAAGHKGVQSIINELGTKNFIRFRIGINNLKDLRVRPLSNESLEKFVLKRFARKEQAIINKIIKQANEAIDILLKQGIERTMSQYN